MKTRMKWRLAAMPLVIAGIAIPAVACEQLPGGGTNPLCCSEFTPGADLSGINWGIEGTEGISFAAFMQASADFAGTAGATVNDVAAACRQLAIDLELDDMTIQTNDRLTDPAARAKTWCNAAQTQLKAKLAGAAITINYQPPACTVSVNAQASCEAKCTANAQCQAELGDITLRCDPGQLSGRCDAMCTATCEGSANLAVTCDGACSGTCEGMCNAAPSTGACAGTCTGKCRGSCKVAAMGGVMCEGDCTGGCSVAVKAPKCKGTLKPPSAMCNAEAKCEGSCQASASAKAECKDPSLDISSSVDPKVVAAIKLHLPKLIAVAEARGKLLVENAAAIVKFGADFTATSSNLSVKAGLCILPAVSAIGQASASVGAGLCGSTQVVAAAQGLPSMPCQ
jgi:hypothetical protein